MNVSIDPETTPSSAGTDPQASSEVSLKVLRERVTQLDQLRDAGVLDQATYASARTLLEQQIVARVLNGELEPAPVTVSPQAATGHAAAAQASGASRKASMWVWSSITAAVVLAGGAGYFWVGAPTGSPAAVAMGGGASTDGRTAPHPMGNDAMLGMVESLAQRLKEKPSDGEGWAMLARSYSTLNRHAEALPAYAKAVELVKDDAALMADYADALALKQDRKLQGEPLQWVQKALKLDPRQPKALMLAGTESFERQQYVAAANYWDQVVRTAPTDSPFVQQAQSSRDEARRLGGLPALEPVFSLPKAAPRDTQAATGAAHVSGTVSLSPQLKGKVQPDDTVFIYARAAEGSRMPLAMLKRQVKDLPIRFDLDDSMAMAPQARLSTASQVVVTARVSRSGQAQSQPGDLEGASKPVGNTQVDLAVVVDRVLP